MKKILSLTTALLVLCGLVSGCGTQTNPNQPTEPTQNTQPTRSDETQPPELDPDMFTDRDLRTEYTDAARIQLQGSTATSDSPAVQISGSTVTITGEGTYLLSGSLEDGTVVIDIDQKNKLQLVLDGASIHSSTSAALEIRQADKVFLTLAPGSENSITSEALTEEGIDGALFSKQDLTVNGGGKLEITSPAGHGMVCKDDLVLTGGSYTINAASHGLDVNDSVRITGETGLTINAGKDGIHCENNDDEALGFIYIEQGTVQVEAQGDAISAGAYANILGGDFKLTAGGGSVNGNKQSSDRFGGFMGGGGGRPGNRQPRQETVVTEDSTSMKGLKTVGDLTVSGGTFLVDTADDAFHSNRSMIIRGGSFDIKSGDDAFHGEDRLDIIDGQINIRQSYEGLEALKVAVSGGYLMIHADDDGINAAGGNDESGIAGGRDGMFGGGRPGGHFGGNSNGSIEISGGKLAIYSTGDCLDANGSIAVSGGELYVTNPRSGDTSALDSDTGAVITGGRFIGLAASTMMAQSFESSSTQGVLACTVGNQKAGTPLTVTDARGNTLVTLETEYDCVLLVISTPDLVKGETYTLTMGETSGELTAG